MIKAGIIGTGNIGTDLLLKLINTDFIEPVIFAGRRMSSNGIKLAQEKGIPVTDKGIDYFIENCCVADIVYDCTNAIDAKQHAKVFKKQGVKVIDLTPAKVGDLCVPNINPKIIQDNGNVNMITCGGQVSLPLLKYLKSKCNISYAEVVSQISSDTAGMATRINIDKYIETTESAIQTLIGINNCKVILNVNPYPKTVMQTTIFIKTNQKVILEDYDLIIKKTKKYING